MISISWQKIKPVRDVGVLLIALFVPFLFLRTHIRDPKEWNDLDRGIVKVSEPVQEGAAWLARGISNLWGDYVYLVDVKADNKRLVFENARLEERVRRLEAQEAENRRLRRLLGLRESLPGDIVSAQVIGKDVSEFFRVFRLSLDRGGRDVKKEMPVVGLGGVVGIVQRVAGDTVDVKLVVDPESAVDVVVERTGTRGIVRGTGDLTKYALRVEYTQRTDEVDVGDLLVTSGVGRRFPRGIPVARVTRVIKRDFGIYQEVEAEPTVDFSRLEEALVLISPTSDQPVQPPTAKRPPLAMRNTAFVAIGIAFLVVQANLFRLLAPIARMFERLSAALVGTSLAPALPAVHFVESLLVAPNLILPLIVFTGVHEYSLARGAALAFVLGYALDLFAAAPVGLFTFVSVATFGLSRIAGVRLAAQTVPTQIALAFLFTLAQGVMVLVLLAFFHKDPYVARALVSRLLPVTVSTALASPIVFRIAQRIHQVTISVPRPGEGPAR